MTYILKLFQDAYARHHQSANQNEFDVDQRNQHEDMAKRYGGIPLGAEADVRHVRDKVKEI